MAEPLFREHGNVGSMRAPLPCFLCGFDTNRCITGIAEVNGVESTFAICLCQHCSDRYTRDGVGESDLHDEIVRQIGTARSRKNH